MVAQDVVVAVAVDVPVDHTLHVQGVMNPRGFPYGVLVAGVLVPKGALHEHPPGADNVHLAVEVHVHRELAVVIGLGAVGLGAVAEVGVLDPVRRFVPVAAGGNVQVAVTVHVQHRRALAERPKPVAVMGRIVHRPVHLHRHEDHLARLHRKRRDQHQRDPHASTFPHGDSPLFTCSIDTAVLSVIGTQQPT